MAEYTGEIKRFVPEQHQVQVGDVVFNVTMVLFNRLIRKYRVGDRVRIEYLDRVIKSVVLQEEESEG